MFSKKPTKETKHRQYTCRVCGKEDRKGRLVGHVLKHHVPMDRVPYSCSLCNFRCTDKTTLVNHINNYQRHKDEVMRSGLPNLASVLNRSENPIDANSYIYVADHELPFDGLDLFEADSSVFDPQDVEEPALPDWLAGSDLFPSVTSPKFRATKLNLQLPQATNVYGVFPTSTPAPARPNATVRQSNMTTPAFQNTTDSVVVNPPSRNEAKTGMDTLRAPSSTQAVLTLGSQLNLGMPDLIQNQVAQTPAKPTLTNTVKQAQKTPTNLNGTPLKDENVYLLQDILDGSYTNDPLFKEGQIIDSVAPPHTKPSTPKASSSTQTVDDLSKSNDSKMQEVLRALQANGNQLHAVNRNLRSVVGELQNIHGAILSLERTCAKSKFSVPRAAPRGRSRTPLFQTSYRKRFSPSAKENSGLKSTVKKVKRN